MALRDKKGRFVKGHEKLPLEQRMKLSISLHEAAKNNPKYIGDIVKLHPKIYNSWRAIMFTEKGKHAGVDERWRNFRTFYNDVVGSYQDGLLFRRKDVQKPFSVDNFVWVDKIVAGDMRAGVYLTINNRTLNMKQWSEETGIPLGAIKKRYYRHNDDYTEEEIVYGKRIKRDSRTAKDVRDQSVSIRIKASRMISSYKCHDKKLGLNQCDITTDWMIENILTQNCVYCGDDKRIGCDRIDNNKGHTKDNVVPCCVECNAARNKYFSYEEMKEIGSVIRTIKERRNSHGRQD